ncbi:MAG: paraquat-inducible protein A [Bacteroidetes bacterium]|nr:paraquat-inducible protein A [Bacteroidota bacterium]
MKKFTFLFVSFMLLFSGVVFLTFSISDDLAAYHKKKTEMSEKLDFKARFSDVWEYVPFSSAADDKVALWQQLEKESSYYYRSAAKKGFVLAGLVLAFFISNRIYYRKRDHKLQIYGLVMVFSALSFLYLGLQAPFLEIEAFSRDLTITSPFEFTYKGRIYYLYQNKSVLELIKLLYTGGNFLVAICLLLASIIFPVTKLVTSMIVFMNPHTTFSRRAVPVINNLGKWSMADVFVAAIFLAFFSFTNMNVGVDTGSTTLIGTYFFLSFVVLSIASGSVFKKLTGKQ